VTSLTTSVVGRAAAGARLLWLFAAVACGSEGASGVGERPPVAWGGWQLRPEQAPTDQCPRVALKIVMGHSRRPAPSCVEDCLAGDRDSCIATARRRPREAPTPDDAAVQTWLVAACDSGDSEACALRGDLEGAVRACDLGWAQGCDAAGGFDGEDPAYWAQRGCALGAWRSCDAADRLLHAARRHEERLALLEALCAAARSCFAHAAMLDQGLGGPVDLPGAVASFQRACDEGQVLACWEVVQRLRGGAGVAPDPVAADALLLEQVCVRPGTYPSTAVLRACRERGR
jgi:hypothetical protein